jgi:hypothetical protein
MLIFCLNRLFFRIANAYMKKNDLDNAKEAVGKSLIEHYDTPAKKLQKEVPIFRFLFV